MLRVGRLAGVWPAFARHSGSGVRCAARLLPGSPIADGLGATEGLQRLVDREERSRVELRQRPATADGDRHGGHRDVVGSLPEVVAVVGAERVPEAVQLPADRLDVRASGVAAVLGVLHQPGPGLGCVAEPRQVERHGDPLQPSRRCRGPECSLRPRRGAHRRRAPREAVAPAARYRKPVIRVGSIVIRVDDLERQTEFWEQALDYVRRPGDDPANGDFVLLRPRNGSGPNISLDKARSTVQIPPRIHLDLYSEDQAADVERLKGLGATEVQWDKRPADADYVILADLEGNRFCVVHIGWSPPQDK